MEIQKTVYDHTHKIQGTQVNEEPRASQVIIENADHVRHIPGHSNRKEKMNSLDHIFSHAYQLLCARSAHPCTLLGSHFC
jgi:hypothetical protein